VENRTEVMQPCLKNAANFLVTKMYKNNLNKLTNKMQTVSQVYYLMFMCGLTFSGASSPIISSLQLH
jgi:hypothetical protein